MDLTPVMKMEEGNLVSPPPACPSLSFNSLLLVILHEGLIKEKGHNMAGLILFVIFPLQREDVMEKSENMLISCKI